MESPANTLREWLRENPPGKDAFKQTLGGVARRALDGEDFHAAVREFLDEFALLATADQRERAIAAAPPPSGEVRHDAFLAALGEHLAAANSLTRPTWTIAPDRFLDRFWFVSEVEGFRAIAIAQSPAAFRRRGIFIAAGALERC